MIKKLLPILFAVFLLAGCGQKPVFGVSTNADNSISITANRWPKNGMEA